MDVVTVVPLFQAHGRTNCRCDQCHAIVTSMLTSSLIFHRFLQVGKYITWAPLDTSWRRVEKRNPLRLPSCLSRLSKMLAGSDFVSSNNSSCVIEDAEVMIVECMKTSTVRNSDSKNYTVDQNSTVLVDFADVPEDRIANNPKRRRSCHLAQSRCSYATISRKLNFRSRSSDEVVMSKSTEIDEVMIVDEGHQVLLQQQFYTNPLPTIPRPPEDTSDSITKNFRGD